MRKFIKFIALLSTITNLYSEPMSSSNPINAYAVAIYDKNHGENIQALRQTKYDYNGIVYTKIAFFGTLYGQKPKVSIGNSQGRFVKSKDIIKNSIVIGELLTYKHTTVNKGYLEVKIKGKIYDTKVFVR